MHEVVAGGPVQPGMMVEKDRVADDRVGAEHADLAQPFDRRLAVPPHDLVKLDDALRRMDLQGSRRSRAAAALSRNSASVQVST